MSIILKGIDILPYCEGLIFTDHNTVLWTDDDMQIHEYEVIQIPKGHGRLIDADKIFTYGHWEEQAVNEAPTILEAEE